MKNNKSIVDNKKALQEKETMQKHFIREHGYGSSVLELLIEHFKEELEKEKGIKNDNER